MTQYRRRRFAIIVILALVSISGVAFDAVRSRPPLPVIDGATASLPTDELKQKLDAQPNSTLAGNVLETLPVKGRAPKTDYKRTQFGNGWMDMGDCDMRNHILARDLANVTYRSTTDCTVLSGTLQNDPYTGKNLQFTRGANSSSAIQIDHVVALSDAWQKGAQQLSTDRRQKLANDPLNLLAVDGPTNNDKGDSDAATWLPPNKNYRCQYIARQIAVKKKYDLWVTEAERNAMRKILASCPNQLVPQDISNN